MMPYSEKQTIELMIIEAQNQLTKCKVLDRIYQRQRLKGDHIQALDQAMGANQQQTRVLKETIFNLLDFLGTASTDVPLAKELEKLHTEKADKG